MTARVVDVAHKVPVRHGTWSDSAGRSVLQRSRWGPVRTAMGRVVGVQPTITMALDELGSAAWQALENRTVAEALTQLEAQFPDEGRLAERFQHFISELVRRGFLTFPA